MEVVLLFVLAGGLAWMWNRMESLERRVVELEGVPLAGHFATAYREPVSRPPEHVDEEAEVASAPPPPPPLPVVEPIPEPIAFEFAEEEITSEEAPVAERGHGFQFRFDFEEIFGRLLPIWGGGIALTVAGFFLVRWSIEHGMLTQSVRVALGFAFGAALLAAAEFAYRFEHRVRDRRVRQALAGAGLATLYASFYLAGTHYGLIGPAWAFAGLAAVTALAIALSFRFGLPSAVLGLVGGFAAPALAGSTDPNLLLLATYLALVTGGLTVTGQRQQYPWLGLAALAGGLGWGALMLIAGPLDPVGVLAIGGYLVLVGTLLPSMLGSGPLGLAGRLAAAGLAIVQIAALVEQSGYSLLAWGCYLLLGGALAVLGVRFVRLREAGAAAAALSVCLLAAWPAAPGAWFAIIAGAHALVFAAVPLAHVWRREARMVDWGQLALYPTALIAAICIQRGMSLLGNQDVAVAAGALALATLPGFAAWRAWPARGEAFAPGPFGVFASAFVTAMLAELLAVPEWSAPLTAVLPALAAFVLLRGRDGWMEQALKWGIGLAGLVLLLATSGFQESEMLFGDGAAPRWLDALRWLAATLPFGLLLAAQPASKASRRCGEVLAALIGYGTVAMLVPGDWLPVAIAVAMLGLAWRLPNYRSALVTVLTLGALWAAATLGGWFVAGVEGLVGRPVLVGDLPSLTEMLRYVAPLVAGLGGAMLLGSEALARYRRAGLLVAASLALVVIHVAFKQVFAIADMRGFVELGLAERTVWQALLALGALGLAGRGRKLLGETPAATALAVAALGHFVLFSLLLHNPLWAEQAVGSWPVANLLLPSYALAIGLVLWLRVRAGQLIAPLRPAFDAAAMALITLLALSELRQAFSGSLLLAPVGQTEDLLRSILAIAVALGFLGWGARTGQRSWRIGSLVLMLVAVFKVFIFDAAGLEGLARIASFFALGICLIGIGWFYSRQLGGKRPATTGEDAEGAV